MTAHIEPVPVYGAGPAGLAAAEVLASNGVPVVLRDHMAAPARKFLLAGRGGLNLTHSEPLETLLDRYGAATPHLESAIRNFPPAALIKWASGLGIETFVGSSGRVFPRAMKASPLLRAWLRRLENLGVVLETRKCWTGFNEPRGILALGGATWPHLGSTANWLPAFADAGIAVNPFTPSNGRVRVNWSRHFAERHAGAAIKNIALRHGTTLARGEMIVSQEGLEGGAIYALSRSIRAQPSLPLFVDLKPDLSAENVAARLSRPRGKQSRSTFLRKAISLSPPAIALMVEMGAVDPKSVVVPIAGFAGLDRAISSAGGVSWSEVGPDFGIHKRAGWHVAGEMLDWDAPTGGYLLQACFSTGRAAAEGLLLRL